MLKKSRRRVAMGVAAVSLTAAGLGVVAPAASAASIHDMCQLRSDAIAYVDGIGWAYLGGYVVRIDAYTAPNSYDAHLNGWPPNSLHVDRGYVIQSSCWQ